MLDEFETIQIELNNNMISITNTKCKWKNTYSIIVADYHQMSFEMVNVIEHAINQRVLFSSIYFRCFNGN